MEEESGTNLMDILFNLANEVVAARVRMRALLEILEERGILEPDEFDLRGRTIFERDWESIAAEVAPEILLAGDDGA